MKKTCPFYTVFQVLNIYIYTFLKIYNKKCSHHLFLLAFTSEDIIFHNVLELHSTVWKKDFSHKFSLLADSLNPPPPSPHHPL